MPYISVGQENSGSIDLYYEDHGSGKPIFLIHGWPLSGRSWEKQMPVLVNAGYRVIAYDRRGFGDSSKPITGYDYDTFATDLHTLITKLDLHEVALVGFSMGGGEVARYVGKYGTGRVRRAAFLAAIPPFLLRTPDNPSGVDGKVFDGIKAGIAEDRLSFLSGFFSNFYNVDQLRGNRISDQVVQLSWNIAAGASPKGTLECVSAWLTDFRKDLAKFDIPALIVHGDSDRIVPIDASGRRTSELLKGSRMVLVEGGPHGLNWTHADEVNRALLQFLE